MPKIKLSQLSVATTLNSTDIFLIVQNGTNKKTSLATILHNLNSDNHVRVNSLQLAVDFLVATQGDANAFLVDGSTNRVGVGLALPESKFHVNGNVQSGSATTDGIFVQSSEAVVYTSSDAVSLLVKPLSPIRAMTALNCNTGVSGLFSLANGFNGQIKTIFQNTLDVGKTSTISVVGLGFNTITLNAIGTSTILQFNAIISKWVIIGGNAATYSTV